MAEGEYRGVEREHEGAIRELGRVIREYRGVEGEYINEIGISGGVKWRGLSQRTIMC